MIPIKKTLTLTSLSLILAGCNHSSSSSDDSYELMLSALGGERALSAEQQINYHVEGLAYEFQEQPEPQANLLSRFTQNVNATLNGENLRQQWIIDVDYAFDIDLAFTELMVGDQGVVIDDGPNTFGASAFANFGVASDPMTSIKHASREKSWFMSSPLAIVAQIVTQGGEQLTTQYQGQTVTLELDDQSHFPKLARTLEHDPMYGDVIFEVKYLDWEAVGNTYYPTNIISSVDGNIIRDETLSNITLGDAGNAAFDLNETGVAANLKTAAGSEAGYLSSQFYLRSLLMGFPFDATDVANIVSTFIDSEEKVLLIQGVGHYNYAFAIDDNVYLYDAVINNARQVAVLAEVARQFPGKTMAGVILSHNHYDHAGGFRGALANGGNLIVGSSSGDFYESLMARPQTLQANPLLQRANEPVVQVVNDKLTLGEGDETLEIYTVTAGHASEDDMLILYRPFTKNLFFADLYNGGFEGLIFSPKLAPTINQRAQFLLDFVDLKNLDVAKVSPLHGDLRGAPTLDNVRLAAGIPAS